MLSESFRKVLDLAASGDPGAQAKLTGMARAGTLDAHVAELTARADAEWDAMAAEVVEETGGPLSERTLVNGMLEMAGYPAVAQQVDLGVASVDLANVDLLAAADLGFDITPPADPGPSPRLRARIDELERLENAEAWTARTHAQIEAASDLAWIRLRQSEPEDVSAPVDPDSTLTMDEFARKYGIGT